MDKEAAEKYGGLAVIIILIFIAAVVLAIFLPSTDTPKIALVAEEIIEDVIEAETKMPVSSIVNSVSASILNPEK